MDSSDDGVSSGSGSESDSDSDEDGSGYCVGGEEIVFRDGLCDEDTEQGEDPSTDGFLAEICVTYNVTDLEPDGNCGEINSLFLGLCTSDDTDFDPDSLGTGDIDNIIGDDGTNVESASGSRNGDGDLGITVVLEDPDVDAFTLCFENVIVTTGFNQTKDDLDIGGGTYDYSDTECEGTGLPCLNFFFGCDGDLIGPEAETADPFLREIVLSDTQNCDCQNGMSEMTLQYTGTQTASRIVGYYNVNKVPKSKLSSCEFFDVQPGDTISCSAGSKDTFRRKTQFEVYYDGDDDASCSGTAKTKCSKMIVGKSIKNCDELMVLSHIDGDGAFCDVSILEQDVQILESNAFAGTERLVMTDPLRVWAELDLWFRWTLVGLLTAFAALTVMACYLCAIRRRGQVGQSMDEEGLDDIVRHIAMRNALKKRARQEEHDQGPKNSISVDNSIVRHIAMTLRKHTFGGREEDDGIQGDGHLDEVDLNDDEDNVDDEYYDEEDSCEEIQELDVPPQVEYDDEYYFEDDEAMPTVIGFDDGTRCQYAE